MTMDEKQCKLGDMGLGRPMHMAPELDALAEVSSITEVRSILSGYTVRQGTALYMSPEARGAHYGKPSDIFGLGCVLCEILVGRKAFEEVTAFGLWEEAAAATLEAIEQRDELDDDDVATHANLRKLCLRMLANNSQMRPTACMILTSEFLRAVVADLLQRSPNLSRALNQD